METIKQDEQINTILKERIEFKKEIDKLNKMTALYDKNFKKLSSKFEKVVSLTKSVNISETMKTLENVFNSLDKVAETLEKHELIIDKTDIINIEQLKKLQKLESSKFKI